NEAVVERLRRRGRGCSPTQSLPRDDVLGGRLRGCQMDALETRFGRDEDADVARCVRQAPGDYAKWMVEPHPPFAQDRVPDLDVAWSLCRPALGEEIDVFLRT